MIKHYLKLIKISEKIDNKNFNKISSELDSVIQNSLEDEFDVICSWCNKMKIGDAWIEEEPSGKKKLSHGICPECLREFFK